MKINGINGANTQMGQLGMNQAADSYSRNIQNQIANAQKQLQELSSNKEMTLEEKMKKRQEIQQQISDLNMQLRQHQMEQRKEKQQERASSKDNMPGGTKTKAGEKGAGLSPEGMTAMLSADTSIKQARVQGGGGNKTGRQGECPESRSQTGRRKCGSQERGNCKTGAESGECNSFTNEYACRGK